VSSALSLPDPEQSQPLPEVFPDLDVHIK
jgi:hypothetical protein